MTDSGKSLAQATEALDESDTYLDELSDIALIDTLLSSQSKAVSALEIASSQLRAAINGALEILKQPNSRLIYCGAGTSGRVALLDAVELNPTFSWPDSRMKILLAGGDESLVEAQEGAEDDGEAARRALRELAPGKSDILVGIAASGTTPFVLAAVEEARSLGALTIGFSNNANTPLLERVNFPVLLETGAEALAGSTRLAAGTSQKIALNIFSTALMVRLGRVYKGRMVDMRVTNLKLGTRAIRIVCDIVGCTEDEARAALHVTNDDIKSAVLVARGADPMLAKETLERTDRNLAEAIDILFPMNAG